MKPLATAAAGLLLSACVSMPGGEPQQQVQQTVQQRAGADLQWQRDTDAQRAAETAVDTLLADPLTREAAVRVALLNNRDVQARFAELEVAAADWFDAVRLPNPLLDAEARWPAGGGGPAWDLGLTQSLVGLLTRSGRRARADFELQAQTHEAVLDVLALMRDVEAQVVRTQAAAETEAVMQQAVSATGAAAVTAGALYEAGNVPRLHLVRERQLHEQTRLQLARAEGRHRAEREALNRLLGLWGERTGWTLEPRLPPVPDDEAHVVDTGELERTAVDTSLELAALRARLDAAALAAGLADATSLMPVLEAGLVAERDAGGPWERGPALELELPVFDRGQGRRAREHATLEALGHRWWQTAVALRSHAREAAWHQRNAHAQATQVERVLLPQAAHLLELTLRDYNAMEADAFDLLRMRRAQLDTGLDAVNARRDYWLARIAVEHLRRGGAPGGH